MAEGFRPFQHNSDSVYHNTSETNNNTGEFSMLSRRSALNLPLSQMAIPIYTTSTREEVNAGGHVLLQNFIHEEFEHVGLQDDDLEIQNPPPDAFGDVAQDIFSSFRNENASSSLASTPQGYKNELWIQIGSNIREIANQFAASKERPLIRDQADQVDFVHINRESFFVMLNEIFRNGINRTGIVALFFFCSDVLIRCARQKLRDIGIRLFFWVLEFLVDRVCNWVYEHGGWVRVFSDLYSGLTKVAVAITLGIAITCGVVYIRRNW